MNTNNMINLRRGHYFVLLDELMLDEYEDNNERDEFNEVRNYCCLVTFIDRQFLRMG